MKFTIYYKPTGLNVAEYEADTPLEPYKVEAVYSGPDFGTRDEAGTEVDFSINTKTVWSKLEFMRRLTQEERIAIRTLAKTNVLIEDFMDLLNAASEIHSDDPDVITAFSALESLTVLSPGRAAQIMQGE